MLLKTFWNSSVVTGKLCELYRLTLRHAAAEEQFLTLRTLLLHMYAVALTAYNKATGQTTTTGEGM